MVINKQVDIIEQTVLFVMETLKDAEAGHDWQHVQRVWKMSLNILQLEQNANALVTQLAALLHDIADPKFYNGDETIGPRKAQKFLEKVGARKVDIAHVVNIIRHMSFKNSFDLASFSSLEMQIVQDADRLDALGAIGIARTFHYGGYKKQLLYDAEIPVRKELNKEAYTNGKSTSINHFYEKLLHLAENMHTEYARKEAARRHQFMIDFLDQFFAEWNIN